jgi:hypothetical protein
VRRESHGIIKGQFILRVGANSVILLASSLASLACTPDRTNRRVKRIGSRAVAEEISISCNSDGFHNLER